MENPTIDERSEPPSLLRGSAVCAACGRQIAILVETSETCSCGLPGAASWHVGGATGGGVGDAYIDVEMAQQGYALQHAGDSTHNRTYIKVDPEPNDTETTRAS